MQAAGGTAEITRAASKLVRDPAAMRILVQVARLSDPSMRAEGERDIHREAFLDLARRGSASHLGPWVCLEIAKSVQDPEQAEDLRMLAAGRWRERALEWTAFVRLLDEVATRGPELVEAPDLKEKLDWVSDRLLRLSPHAPSDADPLAPEGS